MSQLHHWDEKTQRCVPNKNLSPEIKELVQLSIDSCGFDPKSICLYGELDDCGCNTCEMRNRDSES